MPRPSLRVVARVLLGGVLFLAVAEGAVRLLHPSPKAQVLTDGVRGLTLGEAADGTVVWRYDEPAVASDDCAGASGDLARVAFVGSSIFRGSGVDGPEVFTERLRHAVGDRACVDNLAQPAFTAEQKRAVAVAALGEAASAGRPYDVLYWEVWANDRGRFLRLGDRAVDVGAYPLDTAGRPAPLSLPTGLSGALWGGSALYRYAVLALGAEGDVDRDVRDQWARLLEQHLAPAVEAAEAAGTELVLVLAPPLDQPFGTSAARPYPGYGAVWPFAQDHGLTWLRLSMALEGEDVETLRHDPCCHYSAAGHARLAEVFADDLAARGVLDRAGSPDPEAEGG